MEGFFLKKRRRILSVLGSSGAAFCPFLLGGEDYHLEQTWEAKEGSLWTIGNPSQEKEETQNIYLGFQKGYGVAMKPFLNQAGL